jgi:hypothetical protein
MATPCVRVRVEPGKPAGFLREATDWRRARWTTGGVRGERLVEVKIEADGLSAGGVIAPVVISRSNGMRQKCLL